MYIVQLHLLLSQAKQRKLYVFLMWVPIDSYIAHNDNADMLANRERLFSSHSYLGPNLSDLFGKIRIMSLRSLALLRGLGSADYRCQETALLLFHA